MVERNEVALSSFSPIEDRTTDPPSCSDSSYDEIWEEVVWKWNKAWWNDSEGRGTTKTVGDVILTIDNIDPYLICSGLVAVAGCMVSLDAPLTGLRLGSTMVMLILKMSVIPRADSTKTFAITRLLGGTAFR